MDWRLLKDIPPWEWPAGAAERLLEVLRGSQTSEEDLARHCALIFVEPRPWDTLVFERNGRKTRIELTPTVASNAGDFLRDMAIAGVGIAAMPSFIAQNAVREGRLEVVLKDWTLLPRPKLWALYPHRGFLPAKVRLFVEALRATFGADSWPE